jgi:hypothetical protein
MQVALAVHRVAGTVPRRDGEGRPARRSNRDGFEAVPVRRPAGALPPPTWVRG